MPDKEFLTNCGVDVTTEKNIRPEAFPPAGPIFGGTDGDI
jgi:hypothetical protein